MSTENIDLMKAARESQLRDLNESEQDCRYRQTTRGQT